MLLFSVSSLVCLPCPAQLNVFAKGETIPDYLMMDLRGKKTGSKVNVSEVFLNEGISLRTKQRQPKEFPVAKLIGSRRGAAADKDKA